MMKGLEGLDARSTPQARDRDRSAPAGEGDTGYVSSAAPAITLPKGGGAIRGMGEKFSVAPVTGTGSLTIPILTSSGRSGFELPRDFRSFDYDTISDIVLHLRYTARDGGGLLKQLAATELGIAIDEFLRTEG